MSANKYIKDGWFEEKGIMWPGQFLALKVEEVLVDERSDYQDVLVFRSEKHGIVLVLDGVIQVTEFDEFSYQEMLVHLAMYSHANPERVLVIGGGDGGCLREIARHECVKEIVICELDQKVIDVSKKYLPSLAVGFDDPRVTTHIGDGAAYMKAHASHFDVIIVDSSDPIGPADVLFEKPFYMAMKSSLRPNGIISTQCESMWLHVDIIARTLKFCREGGYKHCNYAWAAVPTYPTGTIGFAVCTTGDRPCVTPLRTPSKDTKLRYYTPEVHKAAFVLPNFVAQRLAKPDSDEDATENKD